jgi:hypothetical protein
MEPTGVPLPEVERMLVHDVQRRDDACYGVATLCVG